MWVKLRSPLFINGLLYQAKKGGVEMPDELEEKLPKSAEVLKGGKPKAAEPNKEKPIPLSDLAPQPSKAAQAAAAKVKK